MWNLIQWYLNRYMQPNAWWMNSGTNYSPWSGFPKGMGMPDELPSWIQNMMAPQGPLPNGDQRSGHPLPPMNEMMNQWPFNQTAGNNPFWMFQQGPNPTSRQAQKR